MLRLRLTRLCCVTLLLSSFIAIPAAAQTPDTGLIGVSGNIGVFFPDEAFEKALALEGTGEYYVTPRISIRGLFGWTAPGFENRTEDHFRQFKLLFNGVYNWEFGQWHPYAMAGAGAHFVRETLDQADDPDSETRGAINFGGGLEYFIDDRAAIKGELRWEFVTEPAAGPDATGFSLMFGYKVYF